MNIRGTDPAAIASVTDLFAVTAPARDEGLNDFQRALQPPPAAKGYAPPSETKPAAPREESPSKTPASGPTEASQSAQDNQYSDDADDVAEVNEVAQAASESPVAEEADERDVAAESMITAANQVSPQPATKDEPQVVAELLNVNTEAIGEEAASTATEVGELQQVVSAELTPTALPVEQTAVPVTVAEPSTELAAAATTTQDLAEVIPEVAVVTTEEESTGGIGVLQSAVATITATPASTRPTTTARGSRDGQDRSAHIRPEQTSIKETASTEAAPETPIEPALSSPMMRDDNSSDKRNDQKSASNAEAIAQPTNALPTIDPAVTATQSSNTATVEAANQQAAEVTPNANKQPEPPTPQTSPTQATAAIVSRLPAHALVRHATATPESAPLHVDAAKFLQRVAKAFESAQERGGEIRLRLSPPELGALRVEVNMQDQGLVARLEVETAEARALLLENLPILRERLAEQGLRLERFDVDLSKREPEQQGGHLPDQPRDRQAQSEARQAKAAPQRQPLPTNSPTIPSPTTGWQDRQLNVIV